ncbi:MAG TPA: condensation domain-containing protein, partial [Pricia sp.]|nr:condensation domain-containing protein [Pricia sp.]
MKQQKANSLPLTQSQMSIWTGQRMHPSSSLHNVVYTFAISGSLNVSNFRKAFEELLHRTDALRLVFRETDGTPYQSVRPDVEYKLDILDFSAEDVGMDFAPVHAWIRQQTQLPMDLSARIFDSALLQLGDARYIWFLKIHHLVTDAVSNALLFKRMQAIYQGIQPISPSGPPGPGETEATPSFLDYVSHELREREHSGNDVSRAYWMEKTIDAPDVPKFYGNRATGKTTKAPRVFLKLDNKRHTRLRQLAQRPDIRSWTEDLTVFNLFMTLYAVFLHRVSGTSQLVIGSPAHNRGEKQFQNTVGLLIEVLPIWVEIQENDSFKTVLERVKRETNTYLRHARPGAATAKVGRSFTALLNYIHADFPDFNGFPTRTEWVHSGHVDSAHAIRCHIYRFNADDPLEIAFDLHQEVFSEETAQRVPGHFLSVFDALLEDIETPIGKVPLITPQEKKILLGDLGAHSNFSSPDVVSLRSPDPLSLRSPNPLSLPSSDPLSLPSPAPTSSAGHAESPPLPHSILADFEWQASRRPNAVALECGSEIWTYGHLDRQADRLAHHLKKSGIGATHNVALYLYRGPEYIIGILAVMKAGAAFIPIASDQALERIGHILSDSGCSLVLTEESLAENVGSGSHLIVSRILSQQNRSDPSTTDLGITAKPDTPNAAKTPPNPDSPKTVPKPDASNGAKTPPKPDSPNSVPKMDASKPAPKPDATAYILYTSGSTGRPKGVVISHRALSNYMRWAAKFYEVNESSVFPLFTSIGFDLTLTST